MTVSPDVARRATLGFLLLLLIAAALAGTADEASASEFLDRNASSASLKVDGAGHAVVSWRAHGRTRHVIASGSINARAPRRGVPQVSFRLRYGGGSAPGGRCARYDSPPLAWLVRACKAPDGSYWALQSWQRTKPNYGSGRGTWDLRLSHWSGLGADDRGGGRPIEDPPVGPIPLTGGGVAGAGLGGIGAALAALGNGMRLVTTALLARRRRGTWHRDRLAVADRNEKLGP